MTLFHGLPSEQVRAVAQDAEGLMWFGTDAGLARYDGRRIQTVTGEGLTSRRVRALRLDAGGALWVGTDNGAFVRAPGAQAFAPVAGTAGKVVTALVGPAAGRAYAATADGLVFECLLEEGGRARARQVGEQLTTDAVKSRPAELTSLAFAGDTLVVGTRGRGLMTVGGEGAAKEILSRPRPFFVEAVEADDRGALHFGAQTSPGDSGLFKVEAGRLSRPSKVSAGATGTVTALAFSASGDLYAATDGRGVFRYREGQPAERFTFAGTAGGLRSDRVNAVFVDREGVVWFGTDRGVCRYDPQGVRVETLSAETDANFVRSLHRTAAGRLLVGTNRGLFAREGEGRAWRSVEEVAGKTVYAIAEDRRGRILVGTSGGLYVGLQTDGRAPSRPVKLAPEEEGEEKPAEKAKEPAGKGAAEEEAGEKVADAKAEPGALEAPAAAGAEKGAAEKAEAEAAKVKKEAVRKTPEPALSGSVRAVAAFGDSVYVATFGRGLERFDGREVVSLSADERAGRLWVGTANAGLFFFDGREVKSEPALAGLGNTTVWGVSVADDIVWLATSRGLYALRAGAVSEVVGGVDARGVAAVAADGGLPRAWCATADAGVVKVLLDPRFGPVTAGLGVEQGLPTQSAFAVLPGAGGRGAAGGETILVGTTKGLARYEPGRLAPALQLTRVTASRAHQPEEFRGGALRLDYPEDSLVVDVAASASRTFPEQFQYAFVLEDARGRVVKQKLSHDSQFQAEALRPGLYRLTARAYTLDLTASDPLAFEFEIARAPFPWTILSLSVLLALALVALLWGYFQHRRIVRGGEELREANRQLAAARLQLANEAETERRRIARDLHDQTLADLRRLLLLTDEMQQAAPVAPHGAAAAATTTTTPAADPSVLRAEIEAVSQEIRRICEDLSPSVLENVGFAAALEFALASGLAHLPGDCKLSYEFACDEGLDERLSFPPAVQMQVYRIVQEAVSNVCRHARAARVRLGVRLDDAGDFVLTLEDDGRGFDAANKRALRGRGISGIRARANLIDAEATWHRRPPDEGGGTVFTIRKTGAARKDAPA
ncbi:MAG TPA: two-component regulator propeller domain-containing protein [Pyrinomonadaceae bacterium]|nr:two-component regulator propeller domain-containing protein [Pyrinomonadaceae bacterium]